MRCLCNPRANNGFKRSIIWFDHVIWTMVNKLEIFFPSYPTSIARFAAFMIWMKESAKVVVRATIWKASTSFCIKLSTTPCRTLARINSAGPQPSESVAVGPLPEQLASSARTASNAIDPIDLQQCSEWDRLGSFHHTSVWPSWIPVLGMAELPKSKAPPQTTTNRFLRLPRYAPGTLLGARLRCRTRLFMDASLRPGRAIPWGLNLTPSLTLVMTMPLVAPTMLTSLKDPTY